jgi:hypothetical protein
MPHKDKTTSTIFLQAALSVFERCALYIFPYLKLETEQSLQELLLKIRRELISPRAHVPRLHCRDWPIDADTGETLHTLLERFRELEDGHRRAVAHNSVHNLASGTRN